MKVAYWIAWILMNGLAGFTIISTMISNDPKAALGYFFGAILMVPCILVTLALNWGAGFAPWNIATYVLPVLLMMLGLILMLH